MVQVSDILYSEERLNAWNVNYRHPGAPAKLALVDTAALVIRNLSSLSLHDVSISSVLGTK